MIFDLRTSNNPHRRERAKGVRRLEEGKKESKKKQIPDIGKIESYFPLSQKKKRGWSGWRTREGNLCVWICVCELDVTRTTVHFHNLISYLIES